VDEFCASHAGGRRDVASAFDVDSLMQIVLGPADVDVAGSVDDDLNVPAGGGDGLGIADVAAGSLDGKPFEGAWVTGGAGQDADFVTVRQKLADDVVAQEARSAGDEVFHPLCGRLKRKGKIKIKIRIKTSKARRRE
jgi:hypothetical protein